MIQQLLFISFIWFWNPAVFAQGITGPSGAKAWMMGGASVSRQECWSAINNPSGMISLHIKEIGFYSERRFNQNENKKAELLFIFPSPFFTISAFLSYYGFALFNEQRTGISAARKLSDQASLGIQVNYIATHISDYGSAGAFVAAAGFQYSLKDGTCIGMMIFNPSQAGYAGITSDRIPSYARIGLLYPVSSFLKLQLEAEQHLNRQLIIRNGLQYDIHENLSICLGLCSNPYYYTFGTSIRFKKMKLDFATGIHEVLGFTPHLGIGLNP